MAARNELDVIVNGDDRLSPTLDQLQSKLIRFVGFVSSAMTALRIASFPVEAIRSFDKELAGVQKTTGFTDAQIKSLGDSLVDLSRNINVSASDLAKIAAAAGQQGLGREGVEGVRQFTESVSRMSAVLDVTVEEAGTNIGKIASIFKTPLRDIEKAVSAFNEVSNNSTASGEQLLDVVKRIGDAAGSLNLQQSIGLSATGIDLGLSPEVVGSSFQKVFAEMYARAGQFSKLLGTDVNDWIMSVQANGIDALKQYLAALRQLTPQAQQQTIKALSGGGRIGALVTKLVQDTEDTILDRNVANATKGITLGTSAIKEQQTVLKTLDAEISKAQNSFTALGITAGEVFGDRLAGYFAQLNKALESPRVLQFAEAVGGAFLDLFDTIVNGIKYLDSLNLNWENFITFAKLFIGLKLVEAIGAMALRLPFLGAAWRNLTLDATAAAAAQARASAVGAGSLTASIARIKELLAQHEAYKATLATEQTLLANQLQQQQALHAAQVARLNAQGALVAAQRGLANSPASQGITSAKAGVSAAEQAANANALAVQNAQNARLQRAQQEHANRVARIELERIRLQSIARANGDRSALLAATRARNTEMAAEQQSYQRSLTQINAYYARRLQTVQTAGAAEVAASRLGLMRALSAFDGAAAASGMAALQAQAAAAANRVAVLSTVLGETTAQLTLAQRAAIAAAQGYSLLATGARIAASALQGLLAIAGRVFFYLTIIYTIVTALGVTDKVAAAFQKLTDAMGFTSQAARDIAKSEKERAEAHRLANEQALKAAEGLKKFLDVGTGRLNDETRKELFGGLSSQDRDQYLAALKQLVDANESAVATIDAQNKAKDLVPIDIEALTRNRDQAAAQLDNYKKQLEEAQKSVGAINLLPDESGMAAFFAQRQVDKLKEAVAEQEQLVRISIDNLAKYNTDSIANLDSSITNTKDTLEEIKAAIASTFTPESADVFTSFFPKYIEQLQKAEAANKALNDASQELNRNNGQDISEATKNATQAAYDSAFAQVQASNASVQAVKDQVLAAIAQLEKTGGLSEATIGSLSVMREFFNYTDTQLSALLKNVVAAQSAGLAFTGERAAPKPKATQGEGTNKQESESEARRRRSAQLQLARAGLEAEASLRKEYNEQENEENEDRYKENLLSIREYYAERLKIQRDNLDIEARLRRQEMEALNDELDQAKEGSEKLRIQAQITKTEGDIKLLQVQRDALQKQTDRQLRDALRDFSDNVKDQKEALMEYFGAGSEQEAFTASLDTAQTKYRDFITRLEAESKDMPELIPIIDQVKVEAQFKAVEAALDSLSRKSAIATGFLDVTASRITSLGDAGILTRAQVSGLEEKNRKAVIAVQEAENERSKKLLASIAAQNGGLGSQTDKYKELQLQIEQRSAEIDGLKLKGNEVANSINADLKSNLSQAVTDLRESGGDFRTAFENFLVNIVNSLADKAQEGLVDIIMKGLNSVAGEGFGGFFSNLLGGSAASVGETSVGLASDTAAASTGLLTDAVTPGSTPGNPLFVVDASQSVLGGGAGDATTGLGSLLGGGAGEGAADAAGNVAEVADKGFFTEAFTGLSDSIGGFAGTVGSGILNSGSSIVDGLGNLGGSLISFLGTLMNSIIAAIATAGAASAASGAVGSAAGAGAGAAHNGGIAGRTTMRRTGVSPSVWSSAVRYHTGGKAGLAPNEVPVILEKGEEVLTKEDPRHQDNLGTGGAGESSGGGSNPNFVVQPVLSEDAVLDAFKGAKGQRMLVVQISRNPGAYRQALGLSK